MKIIDLLKQNLEEKNVLLNERMAKYTTFKTGGPADILVKIESIDKLKYVIDIASQNNLPITILGNGSNILVTDKGIRGIVCKIEIRKFEIQEDEDYVFVTVGSGNKNGEISQKLLKLGIEGFEFASGIPRNYWWSNKDECGRLWKRNERYSAFY